jgi:hypothetical protein
LHAVATILRPVVHNDVPLESINRASLPLIRPFLESFVSKESDPLYLHLGEWSESLYHEVCKDVDVDAQAGDISVCVHTPAWTGNFLVAVQMSQGSGWYGYMVMHQQLLSVTLFLTVNLTGIHRDCRTGFPD